MMHCPIRNCEKRAANQDSEKPNPLAYKDWVSPLRQVPRVIADGKSKRNIHKQPKEPIRPEGLHSLDCFHVDTDKRSGH